jgi:hypothetical protein
MAYVRQRTTKAGTTSTALVEAYRDAQGRPRQRLIANLHGESTPLKALAKVAALRDALRKEKEGLAGEAVHANQFYEVVTQNTLHGHRYNAAERKDIDRLMRQRERSLTRLARIERDLAAIQKDGVSIKKHCTATPDEIQAAIKAHEKERRDAEALVLGIEVVTQGQLRKAKAAFRRLST